MNRIARLTLALFIASGIAACSKQEEPPKAAIGPQLQNHVRVLQVIPAGAYTYVEGMGETGEKIWMAGAALDVKVGDSMSFGQYSMMSNYESKTLGRTFDRILFVESWKTGGKVAAVANHGTAPAGAAGALPSGHPPMAAGAPAGHPPMGNIPTSAPVATQNTGVVKSATNAGGYTYAEVQQGNASLWIAAPETALKKGDKVSWDGGAVMQNFTAKSLNQTFDKIVFAGGIAVVK